MTTSSWIQPIAVTRTGSHEEMVVAAASASIMVYASLRDRPEWDVWLSGPFTKSVRRGTAGQWERAAALETAGPPIRVGEAAAVGFVPCLQDRMPSPVHKMQVTGTDRVRTGTWPVVPPEDTACVPVLVINQDLGMSTGKTAAQAAHGMFRWWRRLDKAQQLGWVEQNAAVMCVEVTGDQFTEAARVAESVVTDAGFTEIDAGSVTVAVMSFDAWTGMGLLSS